MSKHTGYLYLSHMRETSCKRITYVSRRILVSVCIYIHTLCMRAAKALATLRIYADSPKALTMRCMAKLFTFVKIESKSIIRKTTVLTFLSY